ncbi:hypothetical protein SAMN05444002_1698 [Vannielia litorea]|uniref:Glycosyltransferase family 92 protein n=2 Tax=Vannielia litorea TaxID=1217970 RepID=A0A1N6FIG9_9RHOB|nr:hypothetical protein SAMN05444002_1698 [Vannielia litorea]
MFKALTLQPLRLPENGPVRRVRLARASSRGPDYDDKFDFLTLAYAGVWLPHKRSVVLICPKLGPLARLLRSADIRGLGQRLTPTRLRRFRRYDELWLSCDTDPGPAIEVLLPKSAGGARLTCGVLPRVSDFDGLLCLTTKSKDNDLDWIADWALHHVRTQGTEGVVLVDNGSTRYTPDDIVERLAGTGLKSALVLSADLPFGPTAKKAPKNLARFYQTAMLNLSRYWTFRQAAAVAINDVDELFVSRGQRTLYEAAAQSWWGYATAGGRWRLRGPDAGHQPRHAEHVRTHVPERFCKEKYCVVPSGRLGGQAWDVHGVARYQWNDWCRARDQYFLHCQEISTGWKYNRGATGQPSAHSAETAEVLATSLGFEA